MNTLLRSLWLLAAIGSASAWAQVRIDNAWARATVQGQKATGAFMKITAPQATRLVGVSTPVAGVAEVHEMKMDGGVMKMRAMPALELPANQTVELKPGGYHLMLIKPKRPLAEGQSVTLTLRFRKAGERTVSFMVHKQMPMADHDMSRHKH